VQVAGNFGMAAKRADAKIAVKGLPLPVWQPYIDSATAAQVVDGKLTLDSTVTADWSKSPAAVQVGASTLGLDSLKIAARGAKAPALALAKGTVQVSKSERPRPECRAPEERRHRFVEAGGASRSRAAAHRHSRRAEVGAGRPGMALQDR
jgi:hypothetical protein